MKVSKGQANPAAVNELLKAKLRVNIPRRSHDCERGKLKFSPRLNAELPA